MGIVAGERGNGGARAAAGTAGTVGTVGFAVACLLVAANLRPAVASVGPVLQELRHDLGLSSTEAGVLTSLPVFCFGVLAPLGPRLTRRIGLRPTIAVLAGTLLAGLALRIGPGVGTLFAGTFVAAGAIAMGNVLIPVIVKRDFARHTGLMLGLYSTALTAFAAAGSGLTVPVENAIGHGWRGGLGVWCVLALVGLIAWLPYARGEDALLHKPEHVPVSLRRDRLAWSVTLFFGLQSLGFYAVLNWLPSLYQSHGYSETAAGGLMSLSSLVQVPIALVLPGIAARLRRQHSLVWLCVALTGGGLLGILLAPTAAATLWVIVLGLGQGAALAVALSVLVLRTRTHEATSQLSAMAQSIGYLIAGLGPLLVGALHAVSDGWTLPLVVLLVLLVPQTTSGLRAATPGYVTDGGPGGTVSR